MREHASNKTDRRVHPDAKRWGGWHWRKPHRGEHFRRCSYCGSIHPDDLAAEPTWTAEWADMKYRWPHKFYVDIPNRHPDNLFVTSSAYSDTPPTPLGTTGPYVATRDLTAEQRAIAQRDGHLGGDRDSEPSYFQFGHRQSHFGKFYTIHLRDRELSAATKAAIEHHCGRAFDFRDDGTIAWQPAP